MKKKAAAVPAVIVALFSLSLSACSRTHAEEGHGGHEEHHRIIVTTPETKDVVITQQYVSQIHSRNHIEIRALQDGYLEEILVKEGQAVKQGDVMFKILPTLYKARLAAERAEAQLAEIKFFNTKKLNESVPPVVSIQEVLLAQAELDKARAKVKLAEAEVEFTIVRAPFTGIVDRLEKQLGSLIEKKDVLTSLTDNSLLWVYFNVPETRYLEYKERDKNFDPLHPQKLKLTDSRIELVLADGNKFNQTAGDVVTIEGKFNNETGNIPFRADFPNPAGLLRHGQTGTVLIHHTTPHALVIPQRATFELLDKRYVWVVGEDHVVHRRLITIQHELEDIYVIQSGLDVKDKIIFDGVRQVNDGDKIEFEFMTPQEAMKHAKHHAE